jgi:hypothetical protein
MWPEKQYRAVGVDREDPSACDIGDWATDLEVLNGQINFLASAVPPFDEIVTEQRVALYSDPQPFDLSAGQKLNSGDCS